MIRMLGLLVFVSTALSQPFPDTLWSRLLQEESILRLCDIRSNSQDNAFICGLLADDSMGYADDPMVYKLTPAGAVAWQYRQFNNGRNVLCSVLPAPDGGCWYSGVTQSNDGMRSDIYIRELSAAGQWEWSTSINLVAGSEYSAFLAPADDGGFFVAGAALDSVQSRVGVYAARFGNNRDTLWTRFAELTGGVNVYAVETVNGGVAVAGTAGFFEVFNPFLILFAANGELLWQVEFPTNGYTNVSGLDFDEAAGMICVFVQDFLTFPAPYTIYRADLEGHDLGNVTLQLPAGNADTTYTLSGLEARDGEFTVAGLLQIGGWPPAVNRPCIVKVDSFGVARWLLPFEGNPDLAEYYDLKIDKTGDESYLFASGYQPSWDDPAAILVYRTGSESTGELIGEVRDGSTLQPLAGVTVRTLPDSARTETNVDGSYRLVLRPGEYTLVFEKHGFCADTVEDVVIENHLQTVRNVALFSPHYEQSVTSISLIWHGQEIVFPFTLANPNGACPLQFSAGDTSVWLFIEPATGVVAPQGSLELRVHVTGPFPGPGEYFSTVEIAHNAGDAAQIPVTVFNVLDAKNPPLTPDATRLHGAFPNPFNATTSITFSLAHDADVVLTVYNLLGREVAVLHEGRLDAGTHTLTLNGESLATGVYIARLTGDGVNLSAKLLLLK